MAETTIRAAIKTALESVTNIGLVYDRLRFAAETDAFLSLFKTTISGSVVIRGWQIKTLSIAQEGFVTTGGLATGNARAYSYEVKGYLQFDDSNSSEITATALMIAVLDALDTTNLFVDTVIKVDLPQANLTEVFFGPVLCHVITITQTITETT